MHQVDEGVAKKVLLLVFEDTKERESAQSRSALAGQAAQVQTRHNDERFTARSIRKKGVLAATGLSIKPSLTAKEVVPALIAALVSIAAQRDPAGDAKANARKRCIYRLVRVSMFMRQNKTAKSKAVAFDQQVRAMMRDADEAFGELPCPSPTSAGPAGTPVSGTR
jgi:hypothetical protein